jgi:hypothetical protein
MHFNSLILLYKIETNLYNNMNNVMKKGKGQVKYTVWPCKSVIGLSRRLLG